MTVYYFILSSCHLVTDIEDENEIADKTAYRNGTAGRPAGAGLRGVRPRGGPSSRRRAGRGCRQQAGDRGAEEQGVERGIAMTELRPQELALFLLGSGETLPRKRARDQQADIAGLELKRRALDLL